MIDLNERISVDQKRAKGRITNMMRRFGIVVEYELIRMDEKYNYRVQSAILTKGIVMNLIKIIEDTSPYKGTSNKDNLAMLNRVLNNEPYQLIAGRGKNSNGSKLAGKSSAYFSVMKKANPTIYRYISWRGKGDMALGYSLYSDYVMTIKTKINDYIYKTGDEARDLANWFYSHGYTSYNGYIKEGNIGARVKGHQVAAMTNALRAWSDFTLAYTHHASLHRMKRALKSIKEIESII